MLWCMSRPEDLLPSVQHTYSNRRRLGEAQLYARRETVFLMLAGLFLGSLAMLNLLGVTRFIALASWSEGSGLSLGTWGEISFVIAVGVLPYPITFLCTDFISELYGRKRATLVVYVGLLINGWVLLVLWVGARAPVPIEMMEYVGPGGGPSITAPPLPEPVYDQAGQIVRIDDNWTFARLQQLTFGAVFASMVAYLLAQLVDVHLFHFWKRLTKGKHLWLRNNASTIVSQLVDTTAVILITHYYAQALPIDADRGLGPQLLLYIATGYVFKLLAALVDTLPFMLGAPTLARFLRLPPPGHPPALPPGAAIEAGVG